MCFRLLLALLKIVQRERGIDSPLMTVAAWLELVGGLLLVLGLFTRLVAFVVAGEMAVAYFMAHCLPAVSGRPAASFSSVLPPRRRRRS